MTAHPGENTVKVWSWRDAVRQSGLSSTTTLVLLNLSLYMNEMGEGCFPSIPTQVKDTRLSERAIYGALSMAEAAGFLKRRKVTRRGIEQNEYFACYPDSMKHRHFGAVPVTKPASDDEKSNARKWIANALAAKKIHRKPCLVCGDKNADAHHHDYLWRENVHWLCRTHHHQLHECEKRGIIAETTPAPNAGVDAIPSDLTPAPGAGVHQVQPTPAPNAGVPLHQVQPNSPLELSNNSPPGASAPETTPGQVVDLFDSIRDEIFGRRQDRMAAPQSDWAWGKNFLEAGYPLEFMGKVFRSRLVMQKDQSQAPVRNLSYFPDLLAKEWKALQRANGYATPAAPKKVHTAEELQKVIEDVPDELKLAIEQVMRKFGPVAWMQWISHLVYRGVENGTARFESSSAFYKDQIEKNYVPDLLKAMREHMGVERIVIT